MAPRFLSSLNICLLLSLTSSSLFSGLSPSFVVSQIDACAVSCCPLVLLCLRWLIGLLFLTHFWWACLVALCSWSSSPPPAPAEYSRSEFLISEWFEGRKQILLTFFFYTDAIAEKSSFTKEKYYLALLVWLEIVRNDFIKNSAV